MPEGISEPPKAITLSIQPRGDVTEVSRQDIAHGERSGSPIDNEDADRRRLVRNYRRNRRERSKLPLHKGSIVQRLTGVWTGTGRLRRLAVNPNSDCG